MRRAAGAMDVFRGQTQRHQKVLFKHNVLRGIRDGKITLAFRRWRRPTVKSGGTLLTAIGQLKILKVEAVSEPSIKASDARKSGYDSLAALMEEVAASTHGGMLYRIELEYLGEDPRIALRSESKLDDEVFSAVRAKLQNLDKRSTEGAWTRGILALIARHPGISAALLAEKSGHEKAWLKVHIRKLKGLGLTESLEVGYRLSPRGKAYLAREVSSRV